MKAWGAFSYAVQLLCVVGLFFYVIDIRGHPAVITDWHSASCMVVDICSGIYRHAKYAVPVPQWQAVTDGCCQR